MFWDKSLLEFYDEKHDIFILLIPLFLSDFFALSIFIILALFWI